MPWIHDLFVRSSPGAKIVIKFNGTRSSLSFAYMNQVVCNCLRLFMQWVARARSLAFDNAGSSNAARIAMMAMTTNNSISVKAHFALPNLLIFKIIALSRNCSGPPAGLGYRDSTELSYVSARGLQIQIPGYPVFHLGGRDGL